MTSWRTEGKIREMYAPPGRRRNRSGDLKRKTRVGRRGSAYARREDRRFGQLMICGTIFVLFVAAKLLFPARIERLGAGLSDLMSRNIDVAEVFSVVGRSFSGKESAGEVWGDFYQAVFQPEEYAVIPAGAVAVPSLETDTLIGDLRAFADNGEGDATWLKSFLRDNRADEALELTDQSLTSKDSMKKSFILYSDENLPESVNMEQAILNFRYCTPVNGTLSSTFGYREHPMEGEDRFHYGIDIAAETGTEIACFADGTVTAVGNSSSYGKYVTVAHDGGYSTLYSHCSKIIVSSGSCVARGQTIAEVGESGIATGPHLHFELHRAGEYLNPIYYVALE